MQGNGWLSVHEAQIGFVGGVSPHPLYKLREAGCTQQLRIVLVPWCRRDSAPAMLCRIPKAAALPQTSLDTVAEIADECSAAAAAGAVGIPLRRQT